MRIGMYNRWLSTLGGGERYSLTIAEYLSRYHQVEVINHKDVSVEEASKRLNLDLSNVKFVNIPDCPPSEITSITGDYDFFINVSYMDYFPSKAETSATLIYFPTPLEVENAVRRNRQIKLAVRRFFRIPSFVSGIYNLESNRRTFTRFLESEARIRLPAHKRKYKLWFDLTAWTSDTRFATISLDGKEIATLELAENRKSVPFSLDIPASTNSMFHELIIQAQGAKVDEMKHSALIALTRFRVSLPRTYLSYLLFECIFKDLGRRLHFIPHATYSVLESLLTYNVIWAISDYTHLWIRKYWGLSSEILYPPVSIEDFKPGEKHNYILNVGRFFAGGHNKKHLTMIKTFKEMVDTGLTGWILHLAGGSTPGAIHDEYLQKVKAEAEGYPICVHADIGFPDLVKLYGESSIYWHASGYGEDEERDPVKFEHFGITTVEAMASGCVPIVIANGGQKEIVKHRKNGFLWQNLDELQRYTLQVIEDPSLRQQMADAALIDSQYYDKVQFYSVLQEQLKTIDII